MACIRYITGCQYPYAFAKRPADGTEKLMEKSLFDNKTSMLDFLA